MFYKQMVRMLKNDNSVFKNSQQEATFQKIFFATFKKCKIEKNKMAC